MIYIELSELLNQWRAANKEAQDFHYAFVNRLGISRKVPVDEHLRHDCELHARSNQLFDGYKAAALALYDYTGRCFQYRDHYIFVDIVEIADNSGLLCFRGPGFRIFKDQPSGSIKGLHVDKLCYVEIDVSKEDPGMVMKELSRTEFQYKYKEMSELCWKQTLKDKIEK